MRTLDSDSSQLVRVLYISPVGERGGAEVVLLSILKHHDRNRFVPMVCLLKNGALATDVRSLGITPLLIATGRLRHVVRTLRAILRIRRFLRENGIHLVFSNMAMGHLYGGLAALGTPVRRVWFQHTISSGNAVDRLAALIPADRVYVNSQASLTAVNRLRPRAGKIQVIYPGTESGSLSCDPIERSVLTREFGVPEGARVVAMVGRFQRGKGQHVFIEAAAAVCREEPDAWFVLVGDTMLGLEPEYKKQIEDLVKLRGLSRSIVFTGWRNDVSTILKEVDVLVHPATAPESFGLVIVEAFLQQKPVVVSCQGGLVEIVTEGETGYRVPPGDSGALADKILLLLRDEGLRRRMGERGRELVLKRFTMSRMIADLERSYIEVVGRPQGNGVSR